MENRINLQTKSFRVADAYIEFSDLAFVDENTKYVDGKPVSEYTCALEIRVSPVHNFPCETCIVIPATDLEELKAKLVDALLLGKEEE